jgi:hypothetical protein
MSTDSSKEYQLSGEYTLESEALAFDNITGGKLAQWS